MLGCTAEIDVAFGAVMGEVSSTEFTDRVSFFHVSSMFMRIDHREDVHERSMMIDGHT